MLSARRRHHFAGEGNPGSTYAMTKCISISGANTTNVATVTPIATSNASNPKKACTNDAMTATTPSTASITRNTAAHISVSSTIFGTRAKPVASALAGDEGRPSTSSSVTSDRATVVAPPTIETSRNAPNSRTALATRSQETESTNASQACSLSSTDSPSAISVSKASSSPSQAATSSSAVGLTLVTATVDASSSSRSKNSSSLGFSRISSSMIPDDVENKAIEMTAIAAATIEMTATSRKRRPMSPNVSPMSSGIGRCRPCAPATARC